MVAIRISRDSRELSIFIVSNIRFEPKNSKMATIPIRDLTASVESHPKRNILEANLLGAIADNPFLKKRL